jgi:hypothetical protein
MDYDDIERKVITSGGELTELKAAVKQLQARVDRHAVVVEVLKDMLLAQGQVSEVEFLKRVQDAAAHKGEAKTCGKCGRPMGAKHNRCMYCGEERPAELL